MSTDWSLIWIVTIVGFCFVVIMLVCLVGIMKLFGYAFTVKKAPKAAKKSSSKAAIDEEVAAIAAAVNLYKNSLHDKTMEVITIHRIKSVYSPWSSKIHGLTQMPEHKR